MKRLCWIIYLPLALIGGSAVNLILSFGASVPFIVEHQVISWLALGVSGVAFSVVLFIIGFRVAPMVNRGSKWLLGGTALLMGLMGIAVAVRDKDTEAMAISVGVLLSALPVLTSSPEQLRKWFRVKPDPLIS